VRWRKFGKFLCICNCCIETAALFGHFVRNFIGKPQECNMSDQPAPKAAFKRVMLKISGEALMGDQGFGLHPPTVERIAKEVKTVHDMGVEICMVIGGGNIFRGLSGSAQGNGAYDSRLHGHVGDRNERARHAKRA
jgi:hypothetical protein